MSATLSTQCQIAVDGIIKRCTIRLFLMQRINILNELQPLLEKLVCHPLETFWRICAYSIDSLLHLAQKNG